LSLINYFNKIVITLLIAYIDTTEASLTLTYSISLISYTDESCTFWLRQQIDARHM